MGKLGAQPSLQDRPITVGEHTFTLRFGIRTVEYLKEKWGVETGEEVTAHIQEKGETLPVLTDLLRGCLATWHKDLDDDDCVEIIDAAGAQVIGNAINDAIVAAMPPRDPSAPQGDAGPPAS